ncbi:MAG: mevalonate kinase [Bradymonadia bacterium]
MTTPRRGTGAAPGKVILFGEHSVVHGQPAIAAALGIGLGATATAGEGPPQLSIPAWQQQIQLKASGAGFDALDRGFAAALEAVGLDPTRTAVKVTVDGELPPSVGLGSSAAFAVALVRALSSFAGERLSTDRVRAAAEQVERVFHGTPSGLDHTVATLGGCLHYLRTSEGPQFTPITLARPIPVVVSWSPRRGSTRQAVSHVGARAARWPDLYGPVLEAMGRIAREGQAALEAGDLARIGALFDINHGHLNALGVSNADNERLVAIAREAGALGAKLTGAGLGGAVIAVAPEDPTPLLEAFEAARCPAFATTVGRGD